MNPSERIRVVLIDDDELTRAALELALPADSVEVIAHAGNGRSGLEACLRLRPDVAFLDVLMPDMDGLQVLPALIDALPTTAVIMVTASNDRITIEKSILGGAAGYIIKPFTPSTVADALNRALRRKAAT
ncbi:MAG: response regulator transcription factor [Pseudomonadota bacterium]